MLGWVNLVKYVFTVRYNPNISIASFVVILVFFPSFPYDYNIQLGSLDAR